MILERKVGTRYITRISDLWPKRGDLVLPEQALNARVLLENASVGMQDAIGISLRIGRGREFALAFDSQRSIQSHLNNAAFAQIDGNGALGRNDDDWVSESGMIKLA